MSARTTTVAMVLIVLLTAGACSASDSSSAPPSTPAVTVSPTTAPVQGYLDAVNSLCDALLPKVVAATHGGQLEATAAAYLHDRPAHQRALADFDSGLAKVVVPPSAAEAAGALTTYIAFADRLDTRRLTAAKQGQPAWTKEMAAEADIESDPAIAGLHAAGFGDSCEAR